MINGIIISVLIAVTLWAVVSLIQLNLFSRFMNQEIDRVYEARISGDRTAMWPDVKACYANLKLYNPFDFNFKRMMVYDHSR